MRFSAASRWAAEPLSRQMTRLIVSTDGEVGRHLGIGRAPIAGAGLTEFWSSDASAGKAFAKL